MQEMSFFIIPNYIRGFAHSFESGRVIRQNNTG